MTTLLSYKYNVSNLANSQRTVASEDQYHVVRLTNGDDDSGIRNRKIKIADRDSQHAENNSARQQLLDAALSACNVTRFDDLPSSVKKAFKVGKLMDDMKLDAQGKVTSGRPLTARRVRRVVAAVEKYRGIFNPTGKTTKAIENKDFAQFVIDDMKTVAAKQKVVEDVEDVSFDQLVNDCKRDWKFEIGGQTFERNEEQDPETFARQLKDPNGKFRTSFSEIFRKEDKTTDLKALALAANLMHQGLLSVVSKSTVPLKLPFYPRQVGTTYTHTVTLDKAEKQGWYKIKLVSKQVGFKELDYVNADLNNKDPGALSGNDAKKIELEEDPKTKWNKNKYELSYEFAFHVDENGDAEFEMIKDPTHTLTIPKCQKKFVFKGDLDE